MLNFSLKAKFAMNIETRGRMVTLLLNYLWKEGNRRLQSSLMNICTTLTQNKSQKVSSRKLCCARGRFICTLRALFTKKSIFERHAPEYSMQITNEYINNLHKLIQCFEVLHERVFMRILKRPRVDRFTRFTHYC